jgi:hypothetical protein
MKVLNVRTKKQQHNKLVTSVMKGTENWLNATPSISCSEIFLRGWVWLRSSGNEAGPNL